MSIQLLPRLLHHPQALTMALLAFAVALLPAHAQADKWDEVVDQIEQSKIVLEDTQRPTAERLLAYREMMEARRRFIDHFAEQSTPDQWQGQSQAAVMRIDQALDMFRYEWNLGSAGDTTLLGIPTDRQRQAATATAADMYRAAIDAKVGIEAAIKSLEGHRQFASDVEMRRIGRSLVQLHRDQRTQLIWSIAAISYAIVHQPVDRRELLEQAVIVLKDLTGLLSLEWAEEARLYLARALLELGRHQEALQVLDELLEQESTRRFRGLVLKGLTRLAQGSLVAARQYASTATEQASTDDERLLAADLAHRIAFAEQRDTSVAYATLREKAFEVDNTTLAEQALDRLMMVQESLGNNQAQETLPTAALLARGLSRAQDAGSYEEADADLRQVLRRGDLTEEDQARALELLGRLALARAKTEQGITFLLQRVNQPPKNEARIRAFSLALESARAQAKAQPQNETAQALLRQALTLAMQEQEIPDLDGWRLEASRLALTEGRNKDALAYATTIIGDRDAAERSYLQGSAVLAGAAQGTFSTEQADQVVTDALKQLEEIEEKQNSSNTFRRRLVLENAQRLLSMGRHTEALIQAEQVVPHDGQVLSILVRCQIELGDMEEALKAMRSLAGHDPKEALNVLGQLAVERGKGLDNNKLDARHLLDEEPGLTPYQELVGHMYEVVQTDQHSEVAQDRQMAWLLLESGRYADAAELYQQLHEALPRDRQFVLGLAESLWRLSASESSADQLAELSKSLALFKQVAASTDNPPTQAETDLFWLSQLRSLQILDRVGRNTGRIGPRINQLRLIDDELGGKGFKEAFVGLANRYPPAP